MLERFTHLDAEGRARMVDVSDKPETHRVAVAEGRVRMAPETLTLVREQALPKGDVLAVALVAGVLAAKQTPSLVPLCHSLLLTDVQLHFELRDDCVAIRASVSTVGRTGAEMEALAAVSVAGLAIYDMCKAIDKGMVLEGICLVEKRGGRQAAPDSSGRVP